MSQAASLPPASPLVVGTKIAGRYLVHRVIGDGGMGTVFEVEHLSLGRRFALKVLLLRSSEDLVRRFEREARSLARINSPRVAQITDFGVDPIVGPFFVMELLEGETLEKRLKRTGAIPEEEAVEIAAEVFEGLQDVHDVGVIHRDIKPSNIGLMSRGPVRVKLIDFGLAVQLDPHPTDGITRSNQMVGTLLYMAPEQFRGQLPSPSMDLYAMGAVLYEMLAGTPPFIGHTAEAIMHQQLQAMPPAFATVAPNVRVSRWLEQIVQRLLEKRPEARYGSAQIVAQALRSRDPHVTGGATAPLPAASVRPAAPSTPPQGSPSAKAVKLPPQAGLISATHVRGTGDSADELADVLFGDAPREGARSSDAATTRNHTGLRSQGEYDVDMRGDERAGDAIGVPYNARPGGRTSRLLGGLPGGARLQNVRTSVIQRTFFMANYWARTAFVRPMELVTAIADAKRPRSERWVAGTLLCGLLAVAVLIVGVVVDSPWSSSVVAERPDGDTVAPRATAADSSPAHEDNAHRKTEGTTSPVTPVQHAPVQQMPAQQTPGQQTPGQQVQAHQAPAATLAAQPKTKAAEPVNSGEKPSETSAQPAALQPETVREAQASDDDTAHSSRRAARHAKREPRRPANTPEKPRQPSRSAPTEKNNAWSGEIIETMKP